MKTPIEMADIKAGDLIRWEMERREDAYEYRASKDGEGYRPHRGSFYLLNRPKRLLWPAGTHLWLTENLYPWSKGDRITLARDWREREVGVATEGSLMKMVVTVDAVTDVEPTPPVELPTEPTLGWLTYAGSTIFGEFAAAGSRSDWEAAEYGSAGCGSQPINHYGSVTAFTAAMAVPTDALDALRGGQIVTISGVLTRSAALIQDFLAAVDEATS